MELNVAIRGRRSIRRYSDKPVESYKLAAIFDSIKYAPTACDRQGWNPIVILDKKLMKVIVDEGAAEFILDAPVGVLITYSNQTDNPPDHLISGSLAIQNMLLTAYSLGLGSCVVCHLPPKKTIRRILSIPLTYDPIAYITFGYPLEEPPLRERQLIVHRNRWQGLYEKPDIKLKLRKLGRSIYYHLPFRRFIKPWVDKRFEKKF